MLAERLAIKVCTQRSCAAFQVTMEDLKIENRKKIWITSWWMRKEKNNLQLVFYLLYQLYMAKWLPGYQHSKEQVGPHQVLLTH